MAFLIGGVGKGTQHRSWSDKDTGAQRGHAGPQAGQAPALHVRSARHVSD